MGQPTNTYDHYDIGTAGGLREDLRDVIYNISPTETPFVQNCSVGSAKQAYHEWTIDSLANAAANSNIDGDDASGDSQTATVRRGNYCQILDKVIVVADSVEAMDRAGRDSEMAYLTAKAGKELKRDLEYNLVGLNQARAAGNNSTSRKFGSLTTWIATNDQIIGTGSPAGASPTGDGTDARTDAGTQAALTETYLNNAITAAWEQGGSPNMIMVGSFNKKKITAFVGNATKYKDVQDRKVINAVDLYVSDFGELTVVPNRFQRARDVWVLDMDMFELAYLPGRSFKVNELAKTGDATKKQMLIDVTLVSKQEKASAGVFDCTTA
jgi:hypothetical protein